MILTTKERIFEQEYYVLELCRAQMMVNDDQLVTADFWLSASKISERLTADGKPFGTYTSINPLTSAVATISNNAGFMGIATFDFNVNTS